MRFDGSFEVANVTVFSKAVTIEEGTVSGHSPHTTSFKHAKLLGLTKQNKNVVNLSPARKMCYVISPVDTGD